MKKFLNFFALFFLTLNFATAQNTFFICDTECRSAPLGDCDSGHTDTDNIEWPCNISIDDATIFPSDVLPDDLEQMPGVVDPLDARPQFENFDSSTMAVGISFEDQVFNSTPTIGFKIVRTWTLIEWFTGSVATRVQLIQNLDTNGANCDVMVCENGLQVALAPGTPPSATIWATDILEGDYSLCNPQNFTLDVMDDAMQVLYSGIGSVTVEEEGSFTCVVTNPDNQNSCWVSVTFEDKTPCQTPFVVCDTECHSAPLGDCDSGHTDTDNIEWPCDVTVNVPSLAASELTPDRMLALAIVDPLDARPTLVNYDCDLVAMAFEDAVIAVPDGSYKILRKWTLIDWATSNVIERSQVIKNTAPQASNCNTLACNSLLNVALGSSPMNPIPTATLFTDAFLEGSYPNCDLNTFTINVATPDGTPVANSTGTVTLTQIGTFNYTITDPSTGNSCWGQLDVQSFTNNCMMPFEVCDTKCRTEPLGDCDSGHTDTDNIEWPCDITVDLAGVEPNDLRVGNMGGLAGVDQLDIQPLIIDYDCNFVARTYEDTVFDLGALGYEILRKWTMIDWLTGNVFEYTQLIKNLAPGAVPSACPQSLACRNILSASLPDNNWEMDFFVSDFLEGGYPNCDIDAFQIDIADQLGVGISKTIGSVTMNNAGTYIYAITDLANGNSCWGNLILSDTPFRLSGTDDLSVLSGVNVFPNPAQDVVNFDYEKLNLKGDVEVSILDQSGRKLISSKNANQLNTCDLATGLYIYQIRMEEEIHHGKISIQR